MVAIRRSMKELENICIYTLKNDHNIQVYQSNLFIFKRLTVLEHLPYDRFSFRIKVNLP
ncbi:hypothetical protein DBR06_SOUSAS20110003, partial [Sousa chinensis]